jgi:hypothetical protein
MECPRIQRWQLPRRRHSACVRAHAKPAPPPSSPLSSPFRSSLAPLTLSICTLDTTCNALVAHPPQGGHASEVQGRM